MESFLNNEITIWLKEHSRSVGMAFAILSAPQVVFWAYIASFGNIALSLSDGKTLIDFNLEFFSYVAISTILSSTILLLFYTTLAFIPTRAFKRQWVRKFAKRSENHLTIRFGSTAIVFAFLYIGPQSILTNTLVALVAYWIIKTRRNLEDKIYDKNFNELELKSTKINSKVKSLTDSVLAGEMDKETALTHLKNIQTEDKEYRNISKSHIRKLRIAVRSHERKNRLNSGVTVALIVISLGSIGSLKADNVKTEKIVKIISTKPVEGVIFGLSTNHMLVFDPKTKNTYALPASSYVEEIQDTARN
jgi:hypothetical protein